MLPVVNKWGESMDVLLISPSYDPSLRPGYSLGLGYLAARSIELGFDTAVVEDSMTDGGMSYLTQLPANTRLVAIGALFTRQVPRALEIAAKLRTIGYDRLIVLGGHGTSFIWHNLLKDCSAIDAVACFESDDTFAEMLAAVRRSAPLADICGLYVRSNSDIVFTGFRPPPTDLDRIPFPFRPANSIRTEHQHASILTSRGCAAHCTFCESGNYGNRYHKAAKWRARSADNVVAEMVQLTLAHNVCRFSIVDDDFLGGDGRGYHRASEFHELLRKHDFALNYAIECRADEIDEGLFRQLMETGLRHVFIGLESGTRTDIALYAKRVDTNRMMSAVETLRRIGLSVSTGFIMFHPLSTLEGVEDNLRLLRRTGTASHAQLLGRLQLYPGSPLIRYFSRRGVELSEYDYQFDYTIVDDVVEAYRTKLTEVLGGARIAEERVAKAVFAVETSSFDSARHREIAELQRRFSEALCDISLELLYALKEGNGGDVAADELTDELAALVDRIEKTTECVL